MVVISSVVLSSGAANTTAATVIPLPTPTPQVTDKGKKNNRPEARPVSPDGGAKTQNRAAGTPTHFYEFTRPGFPYSHVWIEHDDEGRGIISFVKDGDDEKITDPIALSPVTMGKINDALKNLNFLNSTEEYQFERDFSHMGNVTFRVQKDGKERMVKYNWTTNKHAKDLMDEYRRIANEYTWLFEFSVARVNQPLRTPGMMDALDGLLKRKEISYAPHLLKFLAEAASDEKLPLIARNHASRLILEIEKQNR